LAFGKFDLNMSTEIVKQFSDFYIKILKREKTIDATSERLQNEITFPHEFWRGKVPTHINHSEKVLVINQKVSRDLIDQIPIIEGCNIDDIFSGNLGVVQSSPVRCRVSSLISIFDSNPETLDFVEKICKHQNSGVKMVFVPNEANLLLKSRLVNQSLERPHNSSDMISNIKLDIAYYQRLWRFIHSEGL